MKQNRNESTYQMTDMYLLSYNQQSKLPWNCLNSIDMNVYQIKLVKYQWT